ncbi:transcription termination/antitermination protein NusG [Streptomyces sp. NPDC008079]|uniref:transcription termination/antitermination protein NusG n=1 Tax=unclassified Streptomyces TaxID=2593676 RepID=UPI0036EA2BAC
MSHEMDIQVGTDVLITGGPFTDFTSSVVAVDHVRGRVELTVDIFGDVTRIDIPLSDVVRVA